MSVTGLMRVMPVGWKGDTRSLVELLASRHAFEATEERRAEIARRADALLATTELGGAEARGLGFDLATGGWKTRAEAAARLSEGRVWTRWDVTGSLGVAADDGDAPRCDDARIAAAIMIAAREALSGETDVLHDRLKGPARVALVHERQGDGLWDEAAKPLVAEFAANARATGASRVSAALMALSAAVHLKGQAAQGAADETAFLLGAAAAQSVKRPDVRKGASSIAVEKLVSAVSELNATRAELWETEDAEAARLMGAAAACSAFGRGTTAAPSVRARRPRAAGSSDHAAARTRASMTASSAAEAIAVEASDPRLADDDRRRLEALSDLLKSHPLAHAVSCAEALGLEPEEERKEAFRPGQNVYRAARGAVVCTGKNGRKVRCRPVVTDDGAHVGYLAFDALSREFGARPLYAAYALDGTRFGYAWADEPPLIRRGEPEQGFMTAPAAIPV